MEVERPPCPVCGLPLPSDGQGRTYCNRICAMKSKRVRDYMDFGPTPTLPRLPPNVFRKLSVAEGRRFVGRDRPRFRT